MICRERDKHMKYEAIVIGVSAGGMNALKVLLPSLPAKFNLPVILVQHIGASSDGFWIELLNGICPLNVKEADEKEKIEKGNVYIAPPNYHLLVESDRTFSLSADKRVNYARPSIDVLFESAARVYESKLVGILLTGANHDGALGMKKIKECGGFTIVQDPATAESPYMPSSALKITAVDHCLPLEKISELLFQISEL
jgi:two-component system, chemotaxis family, protein-glutamate methylesterase/glutaminase